MCTHCVSPCRNGMILFILGDVKRRTRFVIRVLLSLMTADSVVLCVQTPALKDVPLQLCISLRKRLMYSYTVYEYMHVYYSVGVLTGSIFEYFQ